MGVAASGKVVEVARIGSPIGDLVAVVHEGALRALSFAEGRDDPLATCSRRLGPLDPREGDPLGLARRLAAYFAGDLAVLSSIPVATGGTDFQRRVWTALRRIPVGRTISYGALARRVGSPEAVRAVGAANGANPVAVVVPCHRVIGSDGSLTGYGGGLDRKRWLLAHEGARWVEPVLRPRQERLFE
jgi:methylated-DNA-[protein]-cysteine S-methyltransferase